MEILTVVVVEEGKRLDKLLAEGLPALSRSRLKALIEEGAVQVAGQPVLDPARKLKIGDEAVLTLPDLQEATPQPEAIALDVLHEDGDLIVIHKPAGLVVHPGASNERGTLVNALLHHCRGSLSGINGVLRPGIVHRLDKDTSGVMVAAKTDHAHRNLAAQFADHGRSGGLERAYLALCWGVPARTAITIDAPIGRSSTNREKMAVVREGAGRHAVTHVALEGRYAGASGAAVATRLTCRLETGRTHQIRVHLAHIGHPLLGDPVYGAGHMTKVALLTPTARAALTSLGRQALHAGLLAFEHPRDRRAMRFEAPPPPDLGGLLLALEAKAL